MKKFIIIACLLLSFVGLSQEKEGVYVEGELLDIIVSYIQDAAERGYDVVPHLNQMDRIKFSNDLKFPVLGLASKDGKEVLLSPYITIDTTITKVVLYHELSHSIFKLDHCTCLSQEIMSEHTPDSFVNYYDPIYWKERVKNLFDKIDCEYSN